MPQQSFRTRKTEQSHWRGRYIKDLSPADTRAQDRVGFNAGIEDEINWFIRLAKMDFENASKGELLVLQEDFVALCKGHCFLLNPSTPTPQQIIEVQQIVRKTLEELADQGLAMMPQTPVMAFDTVR